MKRVVVLGATGSVGEKTIKYVLDNTENFMLAGISAHSKYDEIINKYNCPILDTHNEFNYHEFLMNTKPDIVINAISGFAGLQFSIITLKNGITLGLANKESIVCGGHILMELAKSNEALILPVDSEHNSIFQLMQTIDHDNLSHITLTASGGPFWNRKSFENITKEEALKHPNWHMGEKITIDSATMVNKLLEILEAKFLFDLNLSQIHYIVEPSSTIHAMVSLRDGTVLSLMSPTDMIMPISHVLHYPERTADPAVQELDLVALNISFHNINKNVFRIFNVLSDISSNYHFYAIVINAANEVAVETFLNDNISFSHIYDVIEYCIKYSTEAPITSFNDIYETDKQTRTTAYAYCKEL